MSASKQVPTVLAERNQDGVTMYMPNLEIFNPFFSRNAAGVFSSSSLAALAFDLLCCKKALEKNSSLRDLQLHHTLAWLEPQPLFFPLLQGSFDDLCKTLSNDPSILQTAFPRTRGPQGALKMKMEMLQSSSSESSEASEEKSNPSPPPPFPPPPQEKEEEEKAPAQLPPPAAVDLISPEIVDLVSPEDEIQPPHQDSRSPPLSSGSKKVAVRTNWACYPLQSTSQSVLLTKFQVSSGAVSVPLGRAHSVLGAFSKSCTVTLQSPPSADPSSSHSSSWPCGYKLYASQPTQVFLTKLKPFFTAFSVKAGDVLSLSEVSPGICNAQILRASSPQAIEFKSLLANGWSDISPPLRQAVSPVEENTPGTAEKKKKTCQKEAQDGAAVEGQENDADEEEGAITRRRTRQAPRRYILYSSSESQGEDDEEYYVHETKPAKATGIKPRKRGRPAGKEKEQEQQQQQQRVDGADSHMQNQNSELYSTLALQRQNTITKYTAAVVNPFLIAPASVPAARRGPAGNRLRRSPARKPRKALQVTPIIDLTIEEEEEYFVMVNNAPAAVDPTADGLTATAAVRRQKKSRRAASPPLSPPEARTKRHCTTKEGILGSGDKDGSYSSGGGGRTRRPGGRYAFRSDAALLKLRRERRKGIPRRAADGEPNLQAYYDALKFVDFSMCTAV